MFPGLFWGTPQPGVFAGFCSASEGHGRPTLPAPAPVPVLAVVLSGATWPPGLDPSDEALG
jgi:hypothetical protein